MMPETKGTNTGILIIGSGAAGTMAALKAMAAGADGKTVKVEGRDVRAGRFPLFQAKGDFPSGKFGDLTIRTSRPASAGIPRLP
jgi:thioredoxin reductase